MAEPEVDWSFFSMARYLLAAEADDARVMSGAAWDRFLARLAEARLVADLGIPAAPADRASAFRGLLQFLYFGLERTLGSADPFRPVLSRPWPVHLFDYGAGNPDAVYRTASLRDDATYRINGTLGNAAFLSLEFFDGATQAGSLLARDLLPDSSGRFEVLIGPERPRGGLPDALAPGGTERPGHWLEVVSGTSYVLTREFFGDWATASPSDLRIECLDQPAQPWPVLSADRVSRELDALGAWLVETVKVFGGAQARGMAESPNGFSSHVSRPASDLPAIYHGYWDLAPGQCLLIETPAPPGEYWGLQLANGLWNTLDFANRQTSLNRAQAQVDPDGMLRVVVAHADPGVANWLDTLGHRQGALLMRFLSPRVLAGATRPVPERSLAETRDDWMSGWDKDRPAHNQLPEPALHPRPSARVLALEDLPGELPPGTAHITSQQRRAILDERLRQVTRMQRS